MALTKNIYAIPFKKKDLIKVVSDSRVHFAHFRYAIDFIMPEGTKVLAPKSGVVKDIKVDSKEGGSNSKYNNMKYLNYMTLKHVNGEFSQFMHLKYKGNLVKLGDKVKQGQPIALSGNTGFSTAPHLHFQVFRLNKSKIGWETLKIRFKERISIDKSKKAVPSTLKNAVNELKRVKKKLRD